MDIPAGITREDILNALKRLDAGVEHGFGPFLKYDLVFEAHRYPPKAVVGLAAERLAGPWVDLNPGLLRCRRMMAGHNALILSSDLVR